MENNFIEKLLHFDRVSTLKARSTFSKPHAGYVSPFYVETNCSPGFATLAAR